MPHAYPAKVIVIGGGIGGLATGIALDCVGLDVEVFERATGFREVGAGISLWTNALRVLDALGIGPAARAAGLPDVRAGLLDAFGRSRVQLGAELVAFTQDADGVTACDLILRRCR